MKSEKPAKKAAKKPAKKEKPKAEPLKAPKKALILSFRRGRNTQSTNQFLLEVEGCDTKGKAAAFVGKKVVWTAPGKAKKQISGKITSPHGNSGVLRARFSKGLPGTALGQKVKFA